MGPTETPAGETVLLVGGGLGNAVSFSIGAQLRTPGSRVLYFAGYKTIADRYRVEDIERAADEQHGLARRRLGRAHQHERLSRLQEGTEVGRAAHLEDDRRQEIGFLVDRGTG